MVVSSAGKRSLGTGTKKYESNTGRVWAAGFHHVTARSLLARGLKLMNRYFYNFQYCCGQRSTADNESVDTGARL
jgi:hypothetical protein